MCQTTLIVIVCQTVYLHVVLSISDCDCYECQAHSLVTSVAGVGIIMWHGNQLSFLLVPLSVSCPLVRFCRARMVWCYLYCQSKVGVFISLHHVTLSAAYISDSSETVCWLH